MRPDYKLAFRHYSANSASETVMSGVCVGTVIQEPGNIGGG